MNTKKTKKVRGFPWKKVEFEQRHTEHSKEIRKFHPSRISARKTTENVNKLKQTKKLLLSKENCLLINNLYFIYNKIDSELYDD